MKLDKRVALITGGGSGIGRASAILFSKEGARIAIMDTDGEACAETAKMITDSKKEAFCIKGDVTNASEVSMMIKKTVEKYQSIDILFNNAGIAMNPIPIEDIREEYWDRMMEVNLKGIFLCMKYVIPVMKKQQSRGVIINTASAQGVRPSSGRSAYCASKAAVIQLTKAVALEVAADRIRVNCVNPIATDTPMLPRFINESGLSAEKWTESIRSLIAAVPLGRIAKPEDVARAALFLASDEADFITGVALDIDGGRLI